MLSIDTNILFFALNADAPQHGAASAFLSTVASQDDVAISELVLVELYRLLRNPVILSRPLGAAAAVNAIQSFRSHPRWRVVGFVSDSKALHHQLWQFAKQSSFAYRRIFDVRLGLSLCQHGVSEFATTNVKDFAGLGFGRVWNPL